MRTPNELLLKIQNTKSKKRKEHYHALIRILDEFSEYYIKSEHRRLKESIAINKKRLIDGCDELFIRNEIKMMTKQLVNLTYLIHETGFKTQKATKPTRIIRTRGDIPFRSNGPRIPLRQYHKDSNGDWRSVDAIHEQSTEQSPESEKDGTGADKSVIGS